MPSLRISMVSCPRYWKALHAVHPNLYVRQSPTAYPQTSLSLPPFNNSMFGVRCWAFGVCLLSVPCRLRPSTIRCSTFGVCFSSTFPFSLNTSFAWYPLRQNPVAPRLVPLLEPCEKKRPPNQFRSRPPVDARHLAEWKSTARRVAHPGHSPKYWTASRS